MKPLTIEELKILSNGDWIWVDCLTNHLTNMRKFYFQKLGNDEDNDGIYGESRYLLGFLPFEIYGKDWIAYKNKEYAEGVVL